MNTYISVTQLPPISKLLKRRARQFSQRLYNLKGFDVAEQKQFENTKAFIKHSLLLEPVSFGIPSFKGCDKNQEGSLIVKLNDRLRDVIIHQVSFPFTGSKDLFKYAPDRFPIPAERGIIMPCGSCLTVRLNSVFFNRSKALEVARRMLQPTLKLISVNNALASSWSATMIQQVDHEIEAYRKEHNDLYDPNGLLTLTTGLY